MWLHIAKSMCVWPGGIDRHGFWWTAGWIFSAQNAIQVHMIVLFYHNNYSINGICMLFYGCPSKVRNDTHMEVMKAVVVQWYTDWRTQWVKIITYFYVERDKTSFSLPIKCYSFLVQWSRFLSFFVLITCDKIFILELHVLVIYCCICLSNCDHCKLILVAVLSWQTLMPDLCCRAVLTAGQD